MHLPGFIFPLHLICNAKFFLSNLRLYILTLSCRLNFHSYSAIYCMQIPLSIFSFPNVLIIYVFPRTPPNIRNIFLSVIRRRFQSQLSVILFCFFQLLYSHQCCCSCFCCCYYDIWLSAIKLPTSAAPMECTADTDLPKLNAAFWFIQYHYTVNNVGHLNIVYPSRKRSVNVAKNNNYF